MCVCVLDGFGEEACEVYCDFMTPMQADHVLLQVWNLEEVRKERKKNEKKKKKRFHLIPR